MSNNYVTSKKFIVPFLFVFVLITTLFIARFIPRVQAASATAASLTISDSRAGATSVAYTFSFTASASTGIKQMDIELCTTASGTCTGPTGFNVGSTAIQSDTISGTSRTLTGLSANHYRVVVGTTATQSPLSVVITFTGATNSSTTNTTFFGKITTFKDTGTTTIDTATVASATLDTTSLAVSATIDPSLTFSVAGVGISNAVDAASGPNTTVTTTTTTIPFGTVTNGSTNIGAHDVTISTNAGSGFSVTVKSLANPPLVSGSNNIDSFCGESGNTCVNTSPQSWSSPAGSTSNSNTGYFGYTTNDSSLCTYTAARFTSGGPKYAGFDTTPYEVDCASAGVSSETKRIGWRLEINGIQASGSYTGTVILVATPTY